MTVARDVCHQVALPLLKVPPGHQVGVLSADCLPLLPDLCCAIGVQGCLHALQARRVSGRRKWVAAGLVCLQDHEAYTRCACLCQRLHAMTSKCPGGV